MKALKAIIFSWLPLAVAVSGLCLLVSLTVQQSYRQGLNDPQIQMAEDGAARLSSGGVPADIVPRGISIDAAKSLAPWIAVYDGSGMALEADAVLHGAPPHVPFGVLSAAKSGLPPFVGHHLTGMIPAGENRISWQPEDGVRQAIVAVYVPQKDQYVVAGRNMREVEEREGQLSTIVLLAWASIMAASFVAHALRYALA